MPRLFPTLALLAHAALWAGPAGAAPAAQDQGGSPGGMENAGTEKAPPSVGADTVKPGKPAHKPYLADAMIPDTTLILPPPPPSHSAAEAADRVAYNNTRALKGTPRWDLATADVAEGASAILDNFACVLGTRLDQP